jgi:hypothetical protein
MSPLSLAQPTMHLHASLAFYLPVVSPFPSMCSPLALLSVRAELHNNLVGVVSSDVVALPCCSLSIHVPHSLAVSLCQRTSFTLSLAHSLYSASRLFTNACISLSHFPLLVVCRRVARIVVHDDADAPVAAGESGRTFSVTVHAMAFGTRFLVPGLCNIHAVCMRVCMFAV